MNDTELLLLAAKVAGLELGRYDDESGCIIYPFKSDLTNLHLWNPLTDDGDALRLAVFLNIHVLRYGAMTSCKPIGALWTCDERDDGDPRAATRRAIVRAAVEIGRLLA